MYVTNKVALITGGAVGLGFQYAKELLTNGLKGVTLVDIDAIKGQNAAELLNKEFGNNKAIFVKADVVNKADFEDAIKKTVEAFGNFDILINNAGIMNDSVWEREIDINLKGLMNGCVLAHEKYLPKYNSGSEPLIVNISSVAGLSPYYFMPVYSGTKHAVIAISRSLAMKENYEQQKVRVVTICPGATATALLDGLYQAIFTPRLSDKIKTYLEDHPDEVVQDAETMGKSFIKVIENADNGSTWVVKGGNIFEIEMPSIDNFKVLKRL